jgi:hypothetical protein
MSAATKPAQRPTPEDATCFICWEMSQPDYDIELIQQQLDHERFTQKSRRPLPDKDSKTSDSLRQATMLCRGVPSILPISSHCIPTTGALVPSLSAGFQPSRRNRARPVESGRTFAQNIQHAKGSA